VEVEEGRRERREEEDRQWIDFFWPWWSYNFCTAECKTENFEIIISHVVVLSRRQRPHYETRYFDNSAFFFLESIWAKASWRMHSIQ
jgi:hypothetical protein